uniref:Major facilitator superfamily (MFS) profile domain-containing protein n=1 Tax=Tetranychus urticae TaxID=32264 RepID=T1KJ09_TETUR
MFKGLENSTESSVFQSVYTSLLRSSGEPSSRSNNRKQILILIILGSGSFFIAASDALQAPFFPGECYTKGVSFLTCGLIFGAFAITGECRKLLHHRMFAYVTPHTTLRFGLFLTGTTTVLFGVLDKVTSAHEFAIIALFLRIGQAVGVAFSNLSIETLNSNEFDMRWNLVEPSLVTDVAYHKGFIFGSLIGGVLYMCGGYLMPFVIFGSLILLAGLLSIAVLPAPDNYTLMGHAYEIHDGDAVEWTDSFVIASFNALTGFNDVTLAQHLSQFNLSPIGIGSIFMTFRLLRFAFHCFWIRLKDIGLDVSWVSILGITFNIIGLLLIGPVSFIHIGPSLWLIILSLIILAIGISSDDYYRETDPYYKWFNTLPTIAAFIGPVAGGYLIGTIGYRSATESFTFNCSQNLQPSNRGRASVVPL